MSYIGSALWSHARGGQLTTKDRLQYIASALRSRLKRRLASIRTTTTIDYSGLDLDKVILPDSQITKQAFEVSESTYEPWLLNHCLRTYFWGCLIGQLEGITIDPEEFLVISLLHDLGLVGEKKGLAKHNLWNCECFAVRGGLVAEQLFENAGRPQSAANALEGISMHLNVSVPLSARPSSYLLHQGASADVVGWNSQKVLPHREEVLQKYPRLGFKKNFTALLAEEARLHPEARLALMVRFGFLDLIMGAPYEE